ncbi:CobW family GTP-binding protein [Intestinibacter sp.]|uniref:CobW family GTP-binding protein n=1 Tax=Intestinibacter sp. TaxID=1965304 RepID=UPI002A756F82|nr:GTP-binding protein [Intestinibacter sp.]MDY2734362.1 GTP-binding protein [Intestinibacter sp.]MDY4575207.1 GTP-binding protein [Intestinibacter sp.]
MTKNTRVNIISGFLGSGKTTFIKKYLDQAKNLGKVVILENEFGEVSIDSDTLNSEEINIYEINAGCICCSLLIDFKAGLEYILKKFNPDTLFIEPSGVAKVSDIAKILEDFEGIELDKIITIVNAFTFDMYIKAFGEHYKDQIVNADIIYLTRVERLEKIRKNGLDKLINDLKLLNSKALIVDKSLDQLNINDIIYENPKHDNNSQTVGENNLDLSSYTFNVDRIYLKEHLNSLLDEFINFSKYGLIIRSKGIVNDTEGKYLKFDYVDGEMQIQKLTDASKTGIVVIGQNLNQKRIHDLFENLS